MNPAYQRLAGQAASSSDSDEAEFLPIKRTAQQRSKRIEEEEDEEGDEAGSAGKAAGRQAKKAKVSGELLAACLLTQCTTTESTYTLSDRLSH